LGIIPKGGGESSQKPKVKIYIIKSEKPNNYPYYVKFLHDGSQMKGRGDSGDWDLFPNTIVFFN